MAKIYKSVLKSVWEIASDPLFPAYALAILWVGFLTMIFVLFALGLLPTL